VGGSEKEDIIHRAYMENIKFKENMPNISIDSYKETDRNAIIAGIVDLQEVERAISDTRRPGTEVAEEYVRQLQETLSEKRGAIFVARSGENVIGFIACFVDHKDEVAETLESNTYGYISDAYVIPEYRGKGIFGMLNRKAEEHLVQFPEVSLIRINVLARNEQAVRAYEKAGYEAEEIKLMKRVQR
jgi:ribosomal protein S18 acetylase RimI-like enzyme